MSNSRTGRKGDFTVDDVELVISTLNNKIGRLQKEIRGLRQIDNYSLQSSDSHYETDSRRNLQDRTTSHIRIVSKRVSRGVQWEKPTSTKKFQLRLSCFQMQANKQALSKKTIFQTKKGKDFIGKQHKASSGSKDKENVDKKMRPTKNSRDSSNSTSTASRNMDKKELDVSKIIDNRLDDKSGDKVRDSDKKSQGVWKSKEDRGDDDFNKVGVVDRKRKNASITDKKEKTPIITNKDTAKKNLKKKDGNTESNESTKAKKNLIKPKDSNTKITESSKAKKDLIKQKDNNTKTTESNKEKKRNLFMKKDSNTKITESSNAKKNLFKKKDSNTKITESSKTKKNLIKKKDSTTKITDSNKEKKKNKDTKKTSLDSKKEIGDGINPVADTLDTLNTSIGTLKTRIKSLKNVTVKGIKYPFKENNKVNASKKKSNNEKTKKAGIFSRRNSAESSIQESKNKLNKNVSFEKRKEKKDPKKDSQYISIKKKLNNCVSELHQVMGKISDLFQAKSA